jgi:hypothetical protein
VVNDHDVLSGRGVNIAHHPGNQRFRTLVTTRADDNYCTQYSASEKRAVAEEIIKHIKALDPPGRFLKRDTRVKTNSRGLNGPWMEISQREAIKKTCQALRDCNRTDREGYASGVTMPEDVLQEANQRAQLGLSVKQQAEAAVAAAAQSQNEAVASLHQQSFKRARDVAADWGRVSPSVENAAEWLKKQRTDDAMATAAAAAAAVSADFAPNETVVEAANAIYSSNDLLVGTTTQEEEDDIAEAAEVVASITAESNLGGSDDGVVTNMSSYRHPYELSLSAPEEALAREMAGGLMSSSAAGAFNMNATTSTTTATEGFNTTASNTTTTGGGYHESGSLNMHNMNEL